MELQVEQELKNGASETGRAVPLAPASNDDLHFGISLVFRFFALALLALFARGLFALGLFAFGLLGLGLLGLFRLLRFLILRGVCRKGRRGEEYGSDQYT